MRFNKHKDMEGAKLLPLADGFRHGFGIRVWASGIDHVFYYCAIIFD